MKKILSPLSPESNPETDPTKKKTPLEGPGVTVRPNCYGYLRVSTSEQFISGLGLEAQRKAIEVYALDRYPSPVFYEDGGVSGASPVDQRPALSRLLVELHSPAVVIVAKRDRLGRDALLVRLIESQLEQLGAKVESADGVGNGEEPQDRLIKTIIDGFAEFERSVIRARTKAALSVKKSRGEKLGGRVPYGFILSEDGKTLKEHWQEQLTIQLAKELHPNHSYREVARLLQEQGRVARNGQPFEPMQIKRMVEK